MKVLMVHNFYRSPGGEDEVFRNETGLLRRHGHQVIPFTASNIQIRGGNPLSAINTIWAARIKRALASQLAAHQPDIAHFHNTFAAISPSAYYACLEAGVPVVQTLHNYRLFCLNAAFFRSNRICEDCAGTSLPYPGVLHRCYRESASMSAVVAAMLATHRLLGTYSRVIAGFIVFTEFARDKFAALGLPLHKLHVKPNFLNEDPAPGEHRGGFAVFAGRLTPEKGIHIMLEAWRTLRDIPLQIVGDGPLLEATRAFVAEHGMANVAVHGRLPQQETLALMRDASALIFPSQWYEGMPMAIIEAFATGTPVIATRLGAMAAMVRHGQNGLHFAPGDVRGLATQVRRLWQEPGLAERLSSGARSEFLRSHTASQNYSRLLHIYSNVLAASSTDLPNSPPSFNAAQTHP